MEVIIDGVKYVPESDRIKVHGIEYNSVAHWLFNIRSRLLGEWVDLLEDEQVPNSTPEQLAQFEKMQKFEDFVSEFLGFEWDKTEHDFIEKIWK